VVFLFWNGMGDRLENPNETAQWTVSRGQKPRRHLNFSDHKDQKNANEPRHPLHEKDHICLLTNVVFFNDIRSLRNR